MLEQPPGMKATNPNSYHAKTNQPTTNYFESNWDTTKIHRVSYWSDYYWEWRWIDYSSNNRRVYLPLHSGGRYNFTVYWGDGGISKVTSYNSNNRTHYYPKTGNYTIRNPRTNRRIQIPRPKHRPKRREKTDQHNKMGTAQTRKPRRILLQRTQPSQHNRHTQPNRNHQLLPNVPRSHKIQQHHQQHHKQLEHKPSNRHARNVLPSHQLQPKPVQLEHLRCSGRLPF